jgi:formylglycine-generating enzyme required for sulfatase activity
MRLPDGAAFAIDATEVTVESYWKFLHTGTTPAVGPVAHESVCGWNTSFAPKEDAAELDPNCSQHFDFERLVDEEPNRPVVCVDWCDAAAYCSWIGGHLCGLAGGAVMTRDQFGVEDEWYSACSSQGTTAYSYGDEFDAQACNTLNAGHGSVAIAVASLPSCEGPSRGLFDMNGNADEWVAACDSFESEGASLVSCYRVGGAFFQGGVEQSRCDSAYSGYRGLQGNDTGFRCCYD